MIDHKGMVADIELMTRAPEGSRTWYGGDGITAALCAFSIANTVLHVRDTTDKDLEARCWAVADRMGVRDMVEESIKRQT